MQFITGFGTGKDGAVSSASGTINTYATCTGTSGQTSLTTTLSASSGDWIMIHQTQHATAAGTWELVEVDSDAGATLSLKTALVNSYYTGAQCLKVPQYTGGTLSNSITCSSYDGSTGGIIAFCVNGNLSLSGSVASTGNGFRGAVAVTGANQGGRRGEGYTGTNYGDQNPDANGNAGGGGGSAANRGTGAGGGNGTAGSNGSSNATGGYAVGNAGLTSMFLGGGGGGGGTGADAFASSGAGGNGGGAILIMAKTITISGTVYSKGNNGGSAAGPESFAGGGGAGGSILIKSQVATIGTNLVRADGGSAGGTGRIRVDYLGSVDGTTTPTLSSAFDSGLSTPSGAYLYQFVANN